MCTYFPNEVSICIQLQRLAWLRNVRSDPSTTSDLYRNFSKIQHSEIVALDCTFKDLGDQPASIIALRYLETEETVIIQFAGIVLKLS